MAIGRIGDELYLVDDHGAVIDDYSPRYSGPRPADPRRPRRAVPARQRTSTSGARNWPRACCPQVRAKPELARRISQVDVSDPHNAVVIVDGDTARLRLGEERFVERLQSYFDLASTIRESVPEMDYVDLRFGERVYVGSQAQAAAGASGGARARCAIRRSRTIEPAREGMGRRSGT